MFCPSKYKTKRDKRCNKFLSNTTKKEYANAIKDFISCRTEGVVFILECSCSLQYIGRTKRPLWKRLRVHVQNIKPGFQKHSVSRHFAEVHRKNPTELKFWAIEKHKPHWIGSHKIRELSKMESKWIYEINCFAPLGLNIDFNLNCFISDF